MAIRRFDVFATFKMVESMRQGMSKETAMAEGLWLAKLVASRRRGSGSGSKPGTSVKKNGTNYIKTGVVPGEPSEWKELGGIPQTPDLFKKDVIDKVGEDFFENVFLPAIEKAYNDGKTYMDIRDSIRKELAV